jgi:SAM-dependent methyltransferase
MRNDNLARFLRRLPAGAAVMDYGCFDAAVADYCKERHPDMAIDSCDIRTPEVAMESFRAFILLDRSDGTLPIDSAQYDGVIVSHVLEHVPNPIEAVSEILRILKPGGHVYIETPSEKSLQTSSNSDYKKHGFFSFWDDPTHIRPWTPAALYRLAVGFGCDVIEADYIGTLRDKMLYPWVWIRCLLSGDHHALTDAYWRARKFSCYCVVQRPVTQETVPAIRYVTFRKA